MRAAHVLPGGRLATFRAGGGVVYGDLETSLGLQQREGLHVASFGARSAPVRSSPASRRSSTTSTRSSPPTCGAARRSRSPLALLVLAFVLGLSLALAIPFVFAACTIGGTLALLYATAQFVSGHARTRRTSSS